MPALQCLAADATFPPVLIIRSMPVKEVLTHAMRIIVAFMLCHGAALATDWFQYRGPTTDGISPDRMLTPWPGSPTVLWRNSSASNGFSAAVVSQGRVFA